MAQAQNLGNEPQLRVTHSKNMASRSRVSYRPLSLGFARYNEVFYLGLPGTMGCHMGKRSLQIYTTG